MLQWTFNNFDERDSVSSKPGDYSFSSEHLSASTRGTHSQWDDSLGESVFGQSEEPNLALQHVTLVEFYWEEAQDRPLCFPVTILQS